MGGRWGGLAGGIGSAAADLLGGFFVFAPITFVAKGLEGLISGVLGRKNPFFLSFAVVIMVGVYFIAEVFIPGMGFGAALSELPFNLIQAITGAVGGYLINKGVSKSLPQATSD